MSEAATEHTEHSAAPGGDEHASEGGQHAGGHGHKRGHGGHGDHAGGHGGSWIVTYSDMVTLLMALFICIMTFASSESGKHQHRKLRDSVLYGPGGLGIAGTDIKSGDQQSIVWRQVLFTANPAHVGSPIPPLYSDPTIEITKQALGLLEQPAENALSDSYGINLPIYVLFAHDDSLSSTGKHLLDSMSKNIMRLPYEVFVQVDKQQRLRMATAITAYLGSGERIEPSRLAVGIAPPGAFPNDRVRFMFVKRPKEVAR